MSAKDITFDQVWTLARQLRPVDQARLVARLAPTVERLAAQVESTIARVPHKPLRGLLADLGPAPSADEIEEVQREMWAGFGEELS